MNFAEIEPLGIGLAADVAGERPNYRLFIEPRAADERIAYLNVSATHLQLPRVRAYIDDLVESAFPMVYHPVTFNPADANAEPEGIRVGNAEIASYTRSRWAGQDAGAWMWSGQYLSQFMVPAMFDAESASAMALKVRAIANGLPCPFAIENPAVAFSIETMHMLDFMARISREADCAIVLDIGHLLGYQYATGRAPSDMPLERFPFERVIEVHLAGLKRSVSGGYVNYLDQHGAAVTEPCWQLLRELLPRMRNLKGLTLEQEFCDDELVRRHLQRAHRLVREIGVLQ